MQLNIIINFLCFQIAWFACVLGAAYALPLLGVIITGLVVSWHLYNAKRYKLEGYLILIAMLIGATFDQLMVSTQLVSYAHHGWANASLNIHLVPIWIIALWAGFTTSLNVSLRWMRDKTAIAMLFGAIGGPLAYFAAQRLNAVTLHGILSYIVLSIGWAVITPLLLKLSKKFDGYKIKLIL